VPSMILELDEKRGRKKGKKRRRKKEDLSVME
jgi:hypothetical protein